MRTVTEQYTPHMAWLSVVLVWALMDPNASIADRIARAEQLKDDLEYEAARQELLDVIADPRATDEELVRAHMSAGEIARVMERDVDARMHFLYVLSRRPETTIPDDRPPKIRTFFELVRQEVKDRDAQLAAATAPDPVAPTPEAPIVDEGRPPLLALTGGGILAIGAIVLVGALGAAAFGELIYADTTRTVDERQNGQGVAALGWSLAALTLIPAVVGGGLIAAELVLE